MCKSTLRGPATLATPGGKLAEAQLNFCEVFTVFVFDWDDTLLPTSALMALGPEQMKAALEQADSFASEILCSALATMNSHVMMLTNANMSWLQQSARDLMPKVYAILEVDDTKLSIVSAHLPKGLDPSHDNAPPEEAVKRKIEVAKAHAPRIQELIQSSGLATFQVLSVGDGPQDLKAGHALARELHGDTKYVKTVAMKPRPHQMELVGELRALSKGLPPLARIPRSTHQSMFRAPAQTQAEVSKHAQSLKHVAMAAATVISSPTPAQPV